MADWDERYRHEQAPSIEPSPLLVRASKALTPGRALDVACGTGRHVLYLAEHGWSVVAVDASRVAIERVRKRAAANDLLVDTCIADLEQGQFEITPQAYDLICVFYYLQRDLFPQMRVGLRPGGTIVAAIYMLDPSPDLKPMNPAFLLAPGELRAEFEGWTITHDYEGPSHEAHSRRKTAEIIAHRP